jgi:hypothetical protein
MRARSDRHLAVALLAIASSIPEQPMQKVSLYHSWFLVLGALYKAGTELYDGKYSDLATSALLFMVFLTGLREIRKRVAADSAAATTEDKA